MFILHLKEIIIHNIYICAFEKNSLTEVFKKIILNSENKEYTQISMM